MYAGLPFFRPSLGPSPKIAESDVRCPELQKCPRSVQADRGFFGSIRDLHGAGSRIRTDDLLITNQLLYQLSYAGIYEGK